MTITIKEKKGVIILSAKWKEGGHSYEKKALLTEWKAGAKKKSILKIIEMMFNLESQDIFHA